MRFLLLMTFVIIFFIFIYKIQFYIKTSSGETPISAKPNHWLWQSIAGHGDIGNISIKWRYADSDDINTLLDLDLSVGNNYNNIVKSVEYLVK